MRTERIGRHDRRQPDEATEQIQDRRARYHHTFGYMRVCLESICHLFFRGISSKDDGRRNDVSSDDSTLQKFNPQSTCTSQTQLKILEPKNKILHLLLNFSVPRTTVVIVTIKLNAYLAAFHKWTHLL